MATISNDGYADTHYIYGYRDGNARAVVGEYQRRFPEREYQIGEFSAMCNGI